MWHSVGTWMPARRSAVSSISPVSASTVRPLTSIVIMVLSLLIVSSRVDA